MAENNKEKYISPSKLSIFLDNLKGVFSPLTHTHTTKEIEDYVVDDELSATSSNPVQNKVLDAEFQSIAKALNIYEALIDDKADKNHEHKMDDISDISITPDELNFLSGVKSNVQDQIDNITVGSLSNYYTKSEIDSFEFVTISDIDTICGTSL